jgi:hypothetical protein
MNRSTVKIRPIVPLVFCLALVAGCARQAAITDTPTATLVPTAGQPTTVPTPMPTLPAATEAPMQLPAVTAPADAPGSATAVPATPIASDPTNRAIEDAILARYTSSTARIQCIQGDFAAAVVLPPPGGLHGIGAYLRKQDGVWTIAAAGLGIFREDLVKLGFPDDFCGMPPAHDQPQPTAAPDPTTAAITAVIQERRPRAFVKIQCVQGDFAAAAVAPFNGQHGFNAYLRQQDGAWAIATTGLGVPRASLIALGFPDDFCGMPPAINGTPGGAEHDAPDALLQAYYDAINAKDYARAYGYWENPPTASFDEFVQGYGDTSSVALTLGPIVSEGAAGSRYARLPTVLVATHADGREETFAGCYVARQTNADVDPSPRGGKWFLYSATINLSPSDQATDQLLAQGCQE